MDHSYSTLYMFVCTCVCIALTSYAVGSSVASAKHSVLNPVTVNVFKTVKLPSGECVKSVRTIITLYPIGRPVRATIILYPIWRPVRALYSLYLRMPNHSIAPSWYLPNHQWKTVIAHKSQNPRQHKSKTKLT